MRKIIKPAVRELAKVTFIEWFLMGLICTLTMLTVYVSLDPDRRISEASNARRFSDVTAILDDIRDYELKYDRLPSVMDHLMYEQAYEIGQCDSNARCREVLVADSCVDLSEIGKVPVDSSVGSTKHSGYYLIHHKNQEITIGVCAPDFETNLGEGQYPAINLRD